jgi:translation initiation factor 2B subunit (eIF-2B alpha/beta/delta family)
MASDERLATIQTLLQAVASVRPSMAAVANTAALLWNSAADVTIAPSTRVEALRRATDTLSQAWDRAAVEILRTAATRLTGTILTHSRSGTVEHVLTHLPEPQSHSSRRAIVTQSHPGDEGIATAQALAHAGWEVTLIADTAAGIFMPEADVMVIGADSVRPDGSVVNKVGSYPLALVAQAARKPVYVLCETIKIAGESVPLVFEEMSPSELFTGETVGIRARNMYFDLTPRALISGIITEEGLLSSDAIGERARQHDAAMRTLRGN